MDYSPQGSSVHGIFQANTGAGCHFLLQEIFPTQGSNSRPLHLCFAGGFFTAWAIRVKQSSQMVTVHGCVVLRWREQRQVWITFNQHGVEECPLMSVGKDYLLKSYYVLSKGITVGTTRLMPSWGWHRPADGHQRTTTGEGVYSLPTCYNKEPQTKWLKTAKIVLMCGRGQHNIVERLSSNNFVLYFSILYSYNLW